MVRSTRDKKQGIKTHEEYMGGINTDAPTSKSTPPVHFQSCCTHYS